MPGKEQQFVGPDRPSEDKRLKEVAETGRVERDRLFVEADEKIAEWQKVPLGERAEILKGKIKEGFAGDKELMDFLSPENRRVILEKGSAARDFLLGLTPEAMEAVLGEEGMNSVLVVISESRNLLKQIEEDGLNEADLRKFKEENGDGMMPRQISHVLDELESALRGADRFLVAFADMAKMLQEHPGERFSDQQAEAVDTFKRMTINELKISFMNLVKGNEEWRSFLNFDRAKEEKPMDIMGFEKFDFPDIKGREIVEIAAAILPRGLMSVNTGRIEYRDETKPLPEDYGFGGCSFATFGPGEKEGESVIIFYRTPNREVDYLIGLPMVLAHEFGHSIDPRLVGQKDLSPGEQMKMILKWEKVRRQEPEFSTYVKKIKNPDAKKETAKKSIESFAESCAAFLDDPRRLRYSYPKRYRFFANWLKTRFSELDFFKSKKKRTERIEKIYNFSSRIYSRERKA